MPKIIHIEHSVEDFDRAKGDWVARPDKLPADIPPNAPLETYLQHGFKLLTWPGEYVQHSFRRCCICLTVLFYRESNLLASRESRITVAMAGRPVNDPTWSQVAAGCKQAMDRARANLDFGSNGCIPTPPGNKKKKKANRRNNEMKTATQGISFGGGQRVSVLFMSEFHNTEETLQLPGVLKQNPAHVQVFDQLFEDDNIKRAMGFGNSA